MVIMKNTMTADSRAWLIRNNPRDFTYEELAQGLHRKLSREGESDGWYGIDLDGTLAHADDEEFTPTNIGRPIEPMVNLVKKWLSEGKVVRILRRKRLGVFRGLDQRHRACRQLADRADDFRVVRMPDQQDFTAALEMDRRLTVHLGDQRAGCVQREEVARAGVRRNRFRHAMGGKHHRCAGIVGNFGQFLDEDRALGLQAVHDIAVMHDLVADIDGGAIDRERALDGVDGPYHAGTEAAGGTKHDFQVWFG